jgi:hypothetical protein
MADLASELEAVAFRLRRAGDEDLGRELTRAMSRGVQEVPDLIRAGLGSHLPDRYAADLAADLDIKTTARNSGGADADAAVAVYAQTRGKGRRLRRLDAGLLTHPLYGDRGHWYTQAGGGGTGPGMHSGWFTSPCEDAAPRVRGNLEQALENVSNRVTGKGALP